MSENPVPPDGAPRPRPAVGWYPDPEGRPMTRYWNGLAWTDQYGPMAAPAPPTAPPPPVAAGQQPMTVYLPPPSAYGTQVSPHSRLAAFLLCFFLGFLGVHRFYVGKTATGLVMLLTAGGFGVWWVYDFIIILAGGFRDAHGRPVTRWE